MIYLTSDLHLGHDRAFVWQKRGFQSCEEMNQAIIANINERVTDEDDLYILGDLTLGDHEKGIAMVSQLHGRIHIILGNHDTATRMELYAKLPQVVEMCYATVLKYKKFHFYLSHYPTMTKNLDCVDSLRTTTINLHGHTHATSPFYEDIPFIYNVGVDAHNCMPISIEEALLDMKDEFWVCKEMAIDSNEMVVDSKENNNFNVDTTKTAAEAIDEQNKTELLKIFKDNFCSKCIGCTNKYYIPNPQIEMNQSKGKYEVHCPKGDKYRRDPPDGGYYG